MLAKWFLLHMWVTRKRLSSLFATLFRKSVINAVVPSMSLTSMQRKPAIWVNTSSSPILPYVHPVLKEPTYRMFFGKGYWDSLVQTVYLSCFQQILKETSMQIFNREHMKHIDDYLIKLGVCSIGLSHLIISLEVRNVERVTEQAHAVSQQSNPRVLMAWPDLPVATNKLWAQLRAGLFTPGDRCHQEPLQSVCSQWCKCYSCCCCFAYGVAEQRHSQFFSLFILGRETWERRSDPNSVLGCLPPAVPSCSWEKALGTCNSPRPSHTTSHLWIQLPMMNQGWWYQDPGRPRGPGPFHRKTKQEKYPVCPFLSDCPGHEDTHSQPPLNTFPLPHTASQPPHCWLSSLLPGIPHSPSQCVVQVLAAALILEAHTGKSQAVTGTFDILKSLTWQRKKLFPDISRHGPSPARPLGSQYKGECARCLVLDNSAFFFLVVFSWCIILLCTQLDLATRCLDFSVLLLLLHVQGQ